jgi:hypothetical protein
MEHAVYRESAYFERGQASLRRQNAYFERADARFHVSGAWRRRSKTKYGRLLTRFSSEVRQIPFRLTEIFVFRARQKPIICMKAPVSAACRHQNPASGIVFPAWSAEIPAWLVFPACKNRRQACFGAVIIVPGTVFQAWQAPVRAH